MSAGRVGAGLAAAMLLSGCGYSLSERVDNAAAGRSPVIARLPAGSPQAAPSYREPAIRDQGVGRVRRLPASAAGEAPGGFRLDPQTPYVGSPEYERERLQTERRERDLDRRIRGICARC